VLVIHIHRRRSHQLSLYDQCLATPFRITAVMQAARTNAFGFLLLY